MSWILSVSIACRIRSAGIGAEIYYPVPFLLQECFKYLGYKQGDFPQSERAADEPIAISIYPELTPAQQTKVVEAIESFTYEDCPYQ